MVGFLGGALFGLVAIALFTLGIGLALACAGFSKAEARRLLADLTPLQRRAVALGIATVFVSVVTAVATRNPYVAAAAIPLGGIGLTLWTWPVVGWIHRR